MYEALLIARFAINYSNKKEYGISNLKLQKILYFIQAYFLITVNKPCFSDCIEAWDFGPVVPVVYHEFKQFGSGNIPKIDSYFMGNIFDVKVKKFDDSSIDDCDKRNIESVIDEFKDFSATDLVKLTHSQDPWKNAYVPFANNVITNESIKEFFND
ncbi:Panacea domain-containing protein [Phascolarctobacterium succinatutens]|uniref:Panacea domain-containing protein n=1 Tax=Phascolarctobacterium succinatutens TaxID=626940 RepID=UPI003F7FBE2D